MYTEHGYLKTVSDLAEESMKRAVDEVAESGGSGEVCTLYLGTCLSLKHLQAVYVYY